MELGNKQVQLLDDIPSDVRVGRLSHLFHGNELDSRSLLLALPQGVSTLPLQEECVPRFYHAQEVAAHLLVNRGTPGSRSGGMDFTAMQLKSMLQRWINADPENHTRLPLFRAVQDIGKVELACQCLVNSKDRKTSRPRKFA